MSERLIGALFAAALGGGFIAIGLNMRKWLSGLKERGVTTTARIVRSNAPEYTVRFTTDDGTEVKRTIKSFSQVGFGVDCQVVYDPEKPKRVTFPSELDKTTNDVGAWFFIAAGWVFLAIAIAIGVG